MILIYRVLSFLIIPLLLIFVYFRKYINKEDPVRYKEKIFPSHFKVNRKKSLKLIWFHAASIGEFRSIVPIIDGLLKNNQSLEILVTTTTLSSGKLAEIEFKKSKNVYHRYFPFDVNFIVKKFLNSWKPNFIFLVDSEIWPNLILAAKENKIPLALINARLTKKSFNKWIKFPKTAEKIFSSFDLCLSSNAETENYLKKFKAKNVRFYGNIKLVNEINEKKINNLNEEILLKKRFWLAASTHKGEDLFCFKVHKKLKEKFNDIITIIVPRHINRSKNIYTLSKNLNLKTQLLNDHEKILKEKEIIIVNSFGVLQSYFKYAKSVFIGKSLLKSLKDKGGQNPIDAAILNCKIYHGPFVYNFEEIYEILKNNSIAKKIETFDELSDNLINDLLNPKKIEKNISDNIKKLGKKTLVNTMESINGFIK